MSANINSIIVLNIPGVDYRRINVGISKSEARKLLRNADVSEKSAAL